MALSLTTTQSGASSDYIKYLYGDVIKSDRINEPKLLDFNLVPWDGSFVKLARGAYVTFQTATYGVWFTGYITNDPTLEYLGTKGKVPVWGYRYEATSDDYILNLKPIGIRPPFINTTQGAILTSLANSLVAPSIGYPNLLTASEDFTNSAWSKSNITITPNATTDPFGNNTADKIATNATSGALMRQAVASAALGSPLNMTYSVYIKKGSGATVANRYVLRNDTSPANLIGVSVNFDTGAISYTYGSSGASLVSVGNGWWRLTLTASSGWSAGDTVACYCAYTGDSGLTPGDYSYAWGAQLEGNTSVATSYSVSRSTFFDTSNVNAGLTIARYVPDPNAYFSDILKQFADAAGYMWYVKNRCIYYQKQDAVSATITINGAYGTNKHFTPSNLQIQPSKEQVINDVVVLGDIEPQNYMNEYFMGDGYTAQFPLVASAYGTDSSLLLDDDFSGSSIDTTKWTLYDSTGTNIQLSNGYVNFLGGTSTLSDVHLDSAQLIPLEGTVRMTHGQYDFVSASDGVVGGLWSQAVNASFTGCVYGLRATKVSTNTQLQPIVNGTVDGTQTLTVDYTKRYVMRTMMVTQKLHRQQPSYAYLSAAGVVGNYGGGTVADTAVFQTWISEIDPSTGNITHSWTWTNSGVALSASQTYGLYVAAAANDLHCSFTGVTISTPTQMYLEQQVSGSSSWTPKLVGPNEMDSLDGMSPVATIVDSNQGVISRSSVLGTPQYNAGQAILTYFKDTTKQTTQVPQVGDKVHLRYRSAGAAISRVRDLSSVASEATAWKDDGLRTLTKYDLNPSPRNSAECELAAAALLKDAAYQHFEGTYEQWSSYEFTGEAQSGTVLKFQNLPSSFPSTLQAESIHEVRSTFISSKSSELFKVQVTFGRPDRVRQLLANFAKQTDVFQPSDTTEVPNFVNVAGVGTAFCGDVVAPTLTSVSSTNFNFDAGQDPQYYPNLLTYTEDFTNAVWTTANVTSVTANATTDPIGGSAADAVLYSATGTGAFIEQYLSSPGVTVAGQTFTLSVWLKVSAGTQNLNVLIEDQSNNVIANVPCSVTTSWQRFSATGTALGTATGLRAFFYNPDSTTATYYLWGAQLESGSTPTAYIANTGSSRTTSTGFEVRYSDDQWGIDSGKNLVTRSTSRTFSVPRNSRGKVCYVRQYDTRNRLLYSEDFTQSAWGKTGTPVATVANVTTLGPDGHTAQISKVTFGAAASPELYQNAIIPGTSATAVFSIYLKGTAGQGITLRMESEVSPFPGVSQYVVFTGGWQRVSITKTWTSTQLGSIYVVLQNSYDSLNKTFLATWASLEVNTSTETAYAKTGSTVYGAMSRYSAGLRVAYPLVPNAPTATIDYTTVTHPVISVTLPTSVADVWGVEIRANDNSTVLYHQDLTSSSYLPTFTADNSTSPTRSLSYYVYTYNLLGEYSSAYHATATIPTPIVSSLSVDDATKLLKWSGSNATQYTVQVSSNSGYTALTINTVSTDPNFLLADADFFPQRYMKVIPFDTIGSGSPVTTSHVYSPVAPVSFVNTTGGEVGLVPIPPDGATAPTVPSDLQSWKQEVLDRSYKDWKFNADGLGG